MTTNNHWELDKEKHDKLISDIEKAVADLDAAKRKAACEQILNELNEFKDRAGCNQTSRENRSTPIKPVGFELGSVIPEMSNEDVQNLEHLLEGEAGTASNGGTINSNKFGEAIGKIAQLAARLEDPNFEIKVAQGMDQTDNMKKLSEQIKDLEKNPPSECTTKEIEDIVESIKNPNKLNRDELVEFETNNLSKSVQDLKSNFADLVSVPSIFAARTKIKIFFVNLALSVVSSTNTLLQRINNKLHEYLYQGKINKALNSIRDYGHQPLPGPSSWQKPAPTQAEILVDEINQALANANTENKTKLFSFRPENIYGDALSHPPSSDIIQNLRSSNVRIKAQVAQKKATTVKKPSKRRSSSSQKSRTVRKRG